MTTIAFEDINKDFARILKLIEQGEEIVIQQGKSGKLAVIVPYSLYKRKQERQLGILEGEASFKLGDNFKVDDEEFLAS